MLHSPRTFFVLNYLGTLKAAETYFSLGALGSCVTYGGDGSVKRCNIRWGWLCKEGPCMFHVGFVVDEGKPSGSGRVPSIYYVPGTVCIIFSVIDLSQCS